MANSLEDFCRETFKVSNPELIKLFCNTSSINTKKRNQIIIREGFEQHEVPFLMKGTVVALKQNRDGKPVIDCISNAVGDCLVGYTHLGDENEQAIKAIVTIIAVTECEIVSVPLLFINQMIRDYPEASKVYQRFLERSLRLHLIAQRMLYLSPEDRISWFCKQYPDLAVQFVDRGKRTEKRTVKQHHVAAFLNMSQEHFSRTLSERREEYCKIVESELRNRTNGTRAI